MVITHIAENDVLLVAATKCSSARSLQQLPLVLNTRQLRPRAREQVGRVGGERDDFAASYRHGDACRIQCACVCVCVRERERERERERGRGR